MEKTLDVKIKYAGWIPEIYQQGPIVTPITLPVKTVLSLVRKNFDVTAVNKFTKEEVKLTILNAEEPFKIKGDKPQAKPQGAPINPNIGESVAETVQPKAEVQPEPTVEPEKEVEPVVVAEETQEQTDNKQKSKKDFRK